MPDTDIARPSSSSADTRMPRSERGVLALFVNAQTIRKTLKIFHTLASSGMIGALVAYMLILVYAPQDTPRAYADIRQTISVICNYLLLPSMALALVSGLLAMAVHRPFQEMRWVWVKAVLGLSVFEATLGIVQAKANYAASASAKVAAGEAGAEALRAGLANEWMSLGAILTLSVVNVVLGVWRPRLARR